MRGFHGNHQLPGLEPQQSLREETSVGAGARQGCGPTVMLSVCFIAAGTDRWTPLEDSIEGGSSSSHCTPASGLPRLPGGWGRARGDQPLLRTPVKSSWRPGCPEQLAASPLCPEFCNPRAGAREHRALPAAHPALSSSPGSHHTSPEHPRRFSLDVALAQIWGGTLPLRLAWQPRPARE